MEILSHYKKEAQEPLIKKNLLKPNKANGLDMDNYSWGQSLENVTINIPLPRGESVNYFTVAIENSNSLKVGRHLEPLIIDGLLFKKIKADEWSWYFSDKNEICISLPKRNRKWWKSLLKGDPEIDTQNFESKWRIFTSKLWQPVEKLYFRLVMKLTYFKQKLESILSNCS
ncbi:protein BOBBER 2-like [Lycium barbarum]|uniref:protein BOBBER 2-like n=1 Tax=Lycium barbarum TaxID=112863 RepID=UPI00293E7CBF|nr:protein BOBBER 2-like [Lycium barbarum]